MAADLEQTACLNDHDYMTNIKESAPVITDLNKPKMRMDITTCQVRCTICQHTTTYPTNLK